MTSYKPMVKVQGSWHSNALRFAHEREALESSRSLFQRWMAAEDSGVEPSDDEPNYHRWDDHDHSGLITPERFKEQCEASCRAINHALANLGAVIAEHIERTSEPPFVEQWRREVKLESLPSHVRLAVSHTGYALKYARLCVAHDKIVVSSIANDGQRALVVTAVKGKNGGERILESGSWGGPNQFGMSSIDATPVRMIPAGGCIVTACTSHTRSSPWVTIHARATDALAWVEADNAALPVIGDALLEGRTGVASVIARHALYELPKLELEPIARGILEVFVQYKAFARKNEMLRIGSPSDVAIAFENLVATGMLKRTKSGATSITADGRNAVGA